MVVPRDRLVSRHNPKATLQSWQKVSAVTFKPKAGADITKILFAQFKWAVPER